VYDNSKYFAGSSNAARFHHSTTNLTANIQELSFKNHGSHNSNKGGRTYLSNITFILS
jgi:hypothetical protein